MNVFFRGAQNSWPPLRMVQALVHPPMRYEQASDWYESQIKTYHTLQPDLFIPRVGGEALKRFAVIGDAGSGNEDQWAIGQQLLKTYLDKDTRFATVLVLGDNVYDFGEPQLFRSRIYEPYKELFEAGVRFYPVLGNHDVRLGHGEEQLKVWGAPPFYNQRVGDIEFFGLDTTVFVPGKDFLFLENPTLALKKAEIQMTWLNAALDKSTAPIKVVFGHYPIFSSGIHGESMELRKRTDIPTNMQRAAERYYQFRLELQEVMKKHGVNLYLAGDEHMYERTEPIDGVTHIVSGAAGKVQPNFLPIVDYPRKVVKPEFHFMLFEQSADNGLTFKSLGKNGEVLDQGKTRAAGTPVSNEKKPLASA